MRRLKPIAGILIVFLLGALGGVLSARFYATFESRKPHHRPRLEEQVEFIMKRLTDDLDLSATQQKEIRQIVTSSEEKVRSIKDEYAPKVRAIHDASIKEIKTKLTPGQRAEMERMRAEWKRKREDRKSR
jgi:hypothetical protein